MNYDKIKVIAFDADDTLWNNEPYFRNAEHELCRMLAPYGTEEELSERIFGVEMANMPDYGYGAIAFTMSLIESAIKISEGKVRPPKSVKSSKWDGSCYGWTRSRWTAWRKPCRH